jgi:hypothetical protein
MILLTFSFIVVYFVPLITGDVDIDTVATGVVETSRIIEPSLEDTSLAPCIYCWFFMSVCNTFMGDPADSTLYNVVFLVICIVNHAKTLF